MKRNRVRRGREEIAEILSSFERSGQSVFAFAKSQGIAVSSLRLWALRSGRHKTVQRPALLPVTIPIGLPSPVILEVVLLGGRVLRVPQGIAVAELAALCDALERPCSR
ncbi:MAG TPA: hypothetical protein VEL28_06110 [Candidatus Binatia bacterium]|nr:hypothetical protein [Candidatus Binatia bacterium]